MTERFVTTGKSQKQIRDHYASQDQQIQALLTYWKLVGVNCAKSRVWIETPDGLVYDEATGSFKVNWL